MQAEFDGPSAETPVTEWLKQHIPRMMRKRRDALAVVMTSSSQGRIDGWGEFDQLTWETSLNEARTRITLTK